MKLGLLGFPIDHSLSPKLYQKFLGDNLISYELFSFENAEEIPDLDFFKSHLDGLNITSPYKTHFQNQVMISSSIVKEIGAVNTLAFSDDGVFGTNTDVLAVKEILERFKETYSKVHLILLGDGVMANVTKLVASELNLALSQFSRKKVRNFSHLDLAEFKQAGTQTIVINSCSRDFVFKGQFAGNEIFWDYNYSFLPHQNSIPLKVMSYHDGQEMLELQAKAAINFWNQHKTKLK